MLTDFYTLFRISVAGTLSSLLGCAVSPASIDCSAQGCSARSALPLQLHRDANELASFLQSHISAFTLLETALLRDIQGSGGHLLFYHSGAVCNAMLQRTLQELPPFTHPRPAYSEDPVAARMLYTQRRMWMLARKAAFTPPGAPLCPASPTVQQALWLTFAVTERGISRRALELRLLAASDALLTMTHSVLPRQRPALSLASTHVGDAAARLIEHGLTLLSSL